MPQLTLEFSSNVIEKQDIVSLFQACHVLLESTLPTDLESCKSRAIENNLYCVGDGQIDNAFIHVTLKVMKGRTTETLQNVGNSMMNILKDYFSESLKKLNLQITLEINELQKTYFKVTSKDSSA